MSSEVQLDTGAVSVTTGGYGATLVIPEGCSSLALYSPEDVYMSTKDSPADGTSWIIKADVPEIIEDRLLANKTIKFKGVSSSATLRYRYIITPRA